MKKILAVVLSLILACGMLVGCSNKDPILAPDYSASNKEFVTWAYQATSNGWKQELGTDGILRRWEAPEYPIPIENEETLQTYKDCGFNVLFISYTYQFDAREFETSEVKNLMDIAYRKGLKCFLWEKELARLSRADSSLIQPGNADGISTFESQEALNAYVADLIKDVIKHPAFYGFSLRDEPYYKQIDAIAEVYKAIQAAAPGCFVNLNMFPMPSRGENSLYPGGAQMTAEDCYLKYLARMSDLSGAPYIQYDDYPLAGTPETPLVSGMHLINLKVTAEFCKKRGINFYKVFQSSEISTGSYKKPFTRKNTKTDMYWQTNLGMAFGIKQFSYWTYYPVFNTAGEYYEEDSTFLTSYGEKNDMYYWMSDIHKEMQGMAKALMHFEYEGAKIYNSANLPGHSVYAENFNSNDSFNRLSGYNVEGEGSLLITELYDEDAGFYGYFVVNASDPTCDTTLSGTLDFGSFNFVQTYNKGSVKDDRIKKGEYSFSLKTGEGIFVIPYK